MQSIAIVVLSIVAAVVYGILHDQVTARVCVEYFTVGHPPVFHTDDPTLLGFGWGIIATWWVGLLLGVPLAVAALAGRRPQRTARSLVRPVLILMGVNAAGALIAGFAGWYAASVGWVRLFGSLADKLPQEKHIPFIADLWAHLSSYGVGFIGGLIVIALVWRSRIVKDVEQQRLNTRQ